MSNNEIFQRIVQRIEDKMDKYKKPLTLETRLERDLGISGDDAFELIEELSGEFKIDLSEFVMKKYFFPEGDSILSFLLSFFSRKEPSKQMS